MPIVDVNSSNQWRMQTPGHAGWRHTARSADANKYLIVSTDSHANEPADLRRERIEPQYRDRLPRVIVDADGVKGRVSEGHRPVTDVQRAKILGLNATGFFGVDALAHQRLEAYL